MHDFRIYGAFALLLVAVAGAASTSKTCGTTRTKASHAGAPASASSDAPKPNSPQSASSGRTHVVSSVVAERKQEKVPDTEHPDTAMSYSFPAGVDPADKPVPRGPFKLQVYKPRSGSLKRPVTERQVTSVFKELAFDAQPRLNSTTQFAAKRLLGEGPRKAIGIEIFSGNYRRADGTVWMGSTLVATDSGLAQLKDRQDRLIDIRSAVLVGKSLYMSWNAGSGFRWVQFGRLSHSGDLTMIDSPKYYIQQAPTNLMLRETQGGILVERAEATAFNEWENGEVVGSLTDDGERLLIVDGSGALLPAHL